MSRAPSQEDIDRSDKRGSSGGSSLSFGSKEKGGKK